jgi:hypothetical protein
MTSAFFMLKIYTFSKLELVLKLHDYENSACG